MTHSYIFAFFWGFVIAFSFVGWGYILNKLLLPKKNLSWGLLAVLGVSLNITVGAVLNLVHLVRQAEVFGLLGLGLLLFLVFFAVNIKSIFREISGFIRSCWSDKIFGFFVLAIFAVFLIKYVPVVSNNNFNPYDDYQGYVALASQLKQTGYLGNQPFSERKVISSLGGQEFLDTFVSFPLSWNNLQLLDQGVGVIIFIFLLLELLVRRKAITKRLGAVAIFTFLLISFPIENITSQIIALCFMTALMEFFFIAEDFTDNHFVLNAGTIALLFSAVCALKSSFIPEAAMLFMALYFYRFLDAKNKRMLVYEFLLSGCLVLFFLSPWMTAMRQSSGTFLYPLLGKGYDGSRYGIFLSGYQQMSVSNLLTLGFQTMNIVFFMFLPLAFYLCVLKWQASFDSRKLVLIFLTSLGAMAIAAFSTGGYDVYRYTFPFAYPTVIILIVEIINYQQSAYGRELKGPPPFYGVALLCIFMGACLNGFFTNVKLTLTTTQTALKNPATVSAKEVLDYRNMQAALPRGAILAERL